MDPTPDAAGAWTEDLRRRLEEHVPSGPREVAARRRMLDELDRLDRPWDEAAGPVHVTGSAVVVGVRGTVLHRHRRLGRWMQPGGHVDPGESAADAALREAHEETGLGVDHPPGGPLLLHVDVHAAAQGHTHLDVRFLLLGEDAEPAPPAGESQAVRWCTWDEANDLADEALAGALVAARSLWDLHSRTWAARRAGADGRG